MIYVNALALATFVFLCNTKFVEGIVQENARLLFEAARHNDGLGTV